MALPAVEGPGADCAPKAMMFSRDGATLAVAYNDDSIWLLDATTGRKKKVLFPGTCDSHSSSTGRWLVSVSDTRLGTYSDLALNAPRFEFLSVDP